MIPNYYQPTGFNNGYSYNNGYNGGYNNGFNGGYNQNYSMNPYSNNSYAQNYYPQNMQQNQSVQQQSQNVQQGQNINQGQMQQSAPQQMIQSQALMGRIVRTPNEITPNEVPMDGTTSLFPMNDYSAIYAKSWNTDGTIKTVKFVAENSNIQEHEEKNDPFSPIIERLDKIERMIGKNNNLGYSKKSYSPISKESGANQNE